MQNMYFFTNKYKYDIYVILLRSLIGPAGNFGDQRFAAESASHRSQNQKLLAKFSGMFTKALLSFYLQNNYYYAKISIHFHLQNLMI